MIPHFRRPFGAGFSGETPAAAGLPWFFRGLHWLRPTSLYAFLTRNCTEGPRDGRRQRFGKNLAAGGWVGEGAPPVPARGIRREDRQPITGARFLRGTQPAAPSAARQKTQPWVSVSPVRRWPLRQVSSAAE